MPGPQPGGTWIITVRCGCVSAGWVCGCWAAAAACDAAACDDDGAVRFDRDAAGIPRSPSSGAPLEAPESPVCPDTAREDAAPVAPLMPQHLVPQQTRRADRRAAGQADKAEVAAQVVKSIAADIAFSAAEDRFNCDPVANLESLDIFA